MTIEKLAEATANVLHSQCAFDGSYGEALTDGEKIVRALLPLIAAELAEVARSHHNHGDEWFRPNKMATVGETIAIAIEAHARKMGEA